MNKQSVALGDDMRLHNARPQDYPDCNTSTRGSMYQQRSEGRGHLALIQGVGAAARWPRTMRSGIQDEHPSVDLGPLLQRGPQGTVQAVLQVHAAVPLRHVREQVPVERRDYGEQ